MDVIKDSRVNCFSVLFNVTVGTYLDIVEQAYRDRGGIEGQRDSLKTRTAQQIRKRMVEDLSKGTVLPPIVLGIVRRMQPMNELDGQDEEGWRALIEDTPKDEISIIDGMQRTTALKQAVKTNPTVTEREMRVEYWVAPNTNSLIYRMLVLNTGQVPWNMRRQLEVVFRSMVKEIRNRVQGLEVLEIDDHRRRRTAGQFQAHDLIELFLVFGARKTTIDTQERLADEFTRLDFIEATSDSSFTEEFYDVLGFLASLDLAFGRYVCPEEQDGGELPHAEQLDNVRETDLAKPEHTGARFRDGKDLFSSNTARVGFVAAVAEKLLGRPGMELTPEKHQSRRQNVTDRLNSFIERVQGMEPFDVGEFLDFDTLNQVIAVPSAKVGEYERNFFKTAFSVLIDESTELTNMRPCWRAP